MGLKDISPKGAEILSILIEGLLYGVSLPMFGGTIWALWSQRSSRQVNLKMFTVTCLLLLLSTMHLMMHIIWIMESMTSFVDTSSAKPRDLDAPIWTIVSKNYMYTAQTVIGDGVVLYRCYVVWQSKLIMILPVLLWCAVFATGIGNPYAELRVRLDSNFDYILTRWMTAFWASTLSTNLFTTLLLACRIWYVNRKARKLHGARKSQLQSMLHIIVDAGMIYTFTLVVTLICFLCKFNFQYVMQDIITPIISITFYMVIIRVGLANRANKGPKLLTLGCTPTANSMDQGSRMQVHVTTYTESKVETGQRSAMSPALVCGENNCRSGINFDEVTDGV